MENFEQTEKDEIFSRRVPAGKRTYFFDVKATRGNELYMTVTESKKRFRDDGTYFYDKHKIFLYQEDFEKFLQGINEAMDYISANKGDVEPRQYQSNHTTENTTETVAANETLETITSENRNTIVDINFDDLGN